MKAIVNQPNLLRDVPFDINEASQTVHFLDPITRHPIEPHHPPMSLYDHPEMYRGFDFLHSEARDRKLRVALVLAFHGAMEDMDDITQYCGKYLEEADAFGIEASWD